jgi:hypothetical protein
MDPAIARGLQKAVKKGQINMPEGVTKTKNVKL